MKANYLEHPGEDEIWKQHPRFPKYEISTLGRVRSFWMHGTATYSATNPTVKVPNQRKDGYLTVGLQIGKNINRRFKTCWLVLETFVGNRPHKLWACHNNGNPMDDRLCNLRWDTAKSNSADRYKHNTVPLGEKHVGSKLTITQVKEIKKLLAEGKPSTEIAASFGVTARNIRWINQGKTWSQIHA